MDTGKSRPSIRDLMRPDLHHFAGYTPVVPVERLVAETSASSGVALTPIKLDANENPYGPSPRVLQAISESEALHTYPDGEQRTLRAALAEYAGLATENIIVGNGSDEVLDMIIRLLLEPGDKVLSCIPTFGMYKFLTDVAGGQLIELERTSDYGIDLDAIKAATDERTKLIFLASPNNPTGNSVPREQVITLLEMGLFVVIDEAYFEFAGHTVADMVNDYENLMVARTFSKWAGLAGVRIGYAIVSPEVGSYLNQIKQPYNVSVFAQIAALESLRDREYLMRNVQALVQERARLFDFLQGIDYLSPVPSEGNYILCNVTSGNGEQVFNLLKQRNIFVRYYDRPYLKNCFRISVGKPEETDRLVDALAEIGLELNG